MDGHDFIKLAGKLAATPHADQATYRTAVSRAYYGAFHLAKALLENLSFAPPANANVHGFVRHYLHGSGNAAARRAASHLGDFQAARNKADYQLSNVDVGSQAYAVTVVEKAHDVRSALARCAADDMREEIKQAIAEYAKKMTP